ncbi:MAG: RtcB family protein [Bacteroidales bacterium]
MQVINFSNEPENKLYGWLPQGLAAEKVIFFPDVCPGRSPLPTGTVVFTRQADWRKYALSDVGCGMLLLKSGISRGEFDESDWDKVYYDLKSKKGKLGDLGSGNHFIDALESYSDDYVYFLIHTGSRNESGIVDDLVDDADVFDSKFEEAVGWAGKNRMTIAKVLEKYFGELELIVDKNHNHFEKTDDGVIIRKGAVKANPGDYAVLPSSLEGDVVLVRASDKISKVLNSLNHGTGRVMSRSEAKEYAADYDYSKLRKSIYIPGMISDASIKTEAPFCYRELDDCLVLIDELIEIEERFTPFAYLGQI